MRRIGNIFNEIIEMENLRLAFWKASRGKRSRDDQRLFASDLERELLRLRDGLSDGSYPVGNYKRFSIYEPKERTICAAAFPERVLHHALMNVSEPYLDKRLIYDTYACRKGKGQLRAVLRAKSFAKKHVWFLKCDFRKYFDSIPHSGLMTMLSRRFKDRRFIFWLEKIVGTYEVSVGRGLPIGNLTSQHLANLYLDPLDRLLSCGGSDFSGFGGAKVGNHFPYVRYMDDFVLWSNDKDSLKYVRDFAVDFASAELGLELKEPFINRTSLGMDFLGMRIFPDAVHLNRASKARFVRKAKLYMYLFESGIWSEDDFQMRITALTAFTRQSDSVAWRRAFFGRQTIEVG